MVSMNGTLVCDAPGKNVFVDGDGTAVTPDRFILEGITCATALCAELGVPAVPRAVPPGDLLTADEVFLTSTAGGLVPVVRRDGVRVGDGRPGPILRQGTGSAAAGHRAR